ncbi:nitrite reductase small subunit NirD [Rothia kristinae]|uniref:nitrite reductase small subunit NirD n=1 Tax=Rothia kristinae TaxID=37923 RepID=UPI0022E50AD4|nr:nitrite reductase small subunit NirD [Rothia kristinae]
MTTVPPEAQADIPPRCAATASSIPPAPAPDAADRAGGRWLPVISWDHLPREYGVAALLDGIRVAVFRTEDDRLFASSDVDPDTGVGVLSRGIMGDAAGQPTITSPLLKAVYRLTDGSCLTNPALRLPLHTARVREGLVEVLVEEETR